MKTYYSHIAHYSKYYIMFCRTVVHVQPLGQGNLLNSFAGQGNSSNNFSGQCYLSQLFQMNLVSRVLCASSSNGHDQQYKPFLR